MDLQPLITYETRSLKIFSVTPGVSENITNGDAFLSIITASRLNINKKQQFVLYEIGTFIVNFNSA